MKLFVVLSLAAAAAALPTEDCPGCVPYIHEEIPAEEYVHVSGIQAARARGAVAPPQQQAAPVQQFAPQQAAPQRFAPQQQQFVPQQQQFVPQQQQFAPQQQFAAIPARFDGTCRNNKGEGVPCPTVRQLQQPAHQHQQFVPQQQFAPQQQQFIPQQAAPQQQAAFSGTCINNLGAGVPCRS